MAPNKPHLVVIFYEFTLVLAMMSLHIKFEMYSFIRSKDTTGPIKKGHVALTMHIVCHINYKG